jgi:hypothetical protein
MNVAEIVIAASLVALVLIFVRISWTLKEINDTLASGAGNAVKAAAGSNANGKFSSGTSGAESALDENELAAVIAVAYAAYRDAV